MTDEREYWLPILEAWADEMRDDLFVSVHLDYEIHRLRRLLKLPPHVSQERAERRREQTRERVRRYRERERVGAAK